MAQNGNSAFVQGLYHAFAAGNFQYILDQLTENVEWINEGPKSIPYAGTFRGREGVVRFLQTLAVTTHHGRVTAYEFVAEDDKVVSLGRFSATVKATGKFINVPVAHIFTIRDGKVSRWVGYSDTARIAEAHSESPSPLSS